VYDIRDPRAPTEIAYFNPGTADSPAGAVANATVARPVIRTDLRQIWFADIAKGFYTVQFREGVWPFADQDPCPHTDPYLRQYDLTYRACREQRKALVQLPGARSCNTRRSLTVRLRHPANGRITRVAVRVRGKRVKLLRGRRVRRQFTVRRLPRSGRYRVRVVAMTSTGKRVVASRRYRACVPRARKKALSASEPAVLFAAGVDAQGLPYYCRTLQATSQRG
jgi:hypothetical protein